MDVANLRAGVEQVEECMRIVSSKLFGVLGLSVALSAVAEPSSGYKGIPWGAPCSEAVQKMEAKGFVFEGKDKSGRSVRVRSPQESQLFLRGAGRAACSAEDEDLMMDTHQPNPYVEIAAVSGEITVTLLCRNERFVGARLETQVNRRAAAAMLVQAAGAPVRTIRADTCDGKSWKCPAEHSLLLPHGDSVRYLEKPVRSSQDYAGQDPPPIRYLVLARAEDRALNAASVACARKRLAEKQLEQQRLTDGNRAALR